MLGLHFECHFCLQVKFAPAVATGAPGEGEEAVQRPGPGSHQAPAASQSHSGAADQRERHRENTSGAPGGQGGTKHTFLSSKYFRLLVYFNSNHVLIYVIQGDYVELKEGTSV